VLSLHLFPSMSGLARRIILHGDYANNNFVSTRALNSKRVLQASFQGV
jgi:hypothetical protein